LKFRLDEITGCYFWDVPINVRGSPEGAYIGLLVHKGDQKSASESLPLDSASIVCFMNSQHHSSPPVVVPQSFASKRASNTWQCTSFVFPLTLYKAAWQA
jgi:hypothetical protein